jgi:hypothetical protein
MTASLVQMFAAIGMLAIAAAIVFGFKKYLAMNSERRMKSMLTAVGLDAELADNDDIPAIMNEVRSRCRHCQSESVCENWLDGDTGGDNDFCPNHKVFEVLKKYS